MIRGQTVLTLDAAVHSELLHLDLTLKVPVKAAADDIHKYFSLSFRENKT